MTNNNDCARNCCLWSDIIIYIRTVKHVPTNESKTCATRIILMKIVHGTYSVSRVGCVLVTIAAGAFTPPIMVICSGSPLSAAHSILRVVFLFLHPRINITNTANITNNTHPPTTYTTIAQTPESIPPCLSGLTMSFTTIEKCPC
ncbi:hypothetical protein Hanom_Chr10g00892881 [Helianthus anomalus]